MAVSNVWRLASAPSESPRRLWSQAGARIDQHGYCDAPRYAQSAAHYRAGPLPHPRARPTSPWPCRARAGANALDPFIVDPDHIVKRAGNRRILICHGGLLLWFLGRSRNHQETLSRGRQPSPAFNHLCEANRTSSRCPCFAQVLRGHALLIHHSILIFQRKFTM